MLYVYLVASAVLVLLGDTFFELLRQSWSWWGVPLIYIGLFLAFVLLQVGILALSIQIINMKSPANKGTEFYRFMIRITLPMVFKLMGISFNVSGLEKVPEDTRFLLVCNHQHDFDPAIILNFLPYSQLAFIGKKEIATLYPFIDKIMYKLRCLLIDRENDREAAKTIVNAVKLIKADEASVALFPEGYTSPECKLLPFRNGAFKIAYKANVPIVVCVLNNTREIVKNMFRRKTQVDFHILDVIYPEQFSSLHTVELGDKLHEQMNAALREIRK